MYNRNYGWFSPTYENCLRQFALLVSHGFSIWFLFAKLGA